MCIDGQFSFIEKIFEIGSEMTELHVCDENCHFSALSTERAFGVFEVLRSLSIVNKMEEMTDNRIIGYFTDFCFKYSRNDLGLHNTWRCNNEALCFEMFMVYQDICMGSREHFCFVDLLTFYFWGQARNMDLLPGGQGIIPPMTSCAVSNILAKLQFVTNEGKLLNTTR